VSTPVTTTPSRNKSQSSKASNIIKVTFPPGSLGIEFQSTSGRGYGCVIHRMENDHAELMIGDSVLEIDGESSKVVWVIITPNRMPWDVEFYHVLYIHAQLY
jgi:hypothetical protein